MGFFVQGKKPVYKVISKKGYELDCTLDHPFMCYDKKGNLIKKELKDLSIGDEIQLSNHTNYKYNFKSTFLNHLKRNCIFPTQYNNFYEIKFYHNCGFDMKKPQLELLKKGIVSTQKKQSLYIPTYFEPLLYQLGIIDVQLEQLKVDNTINQHIYSDHIKKIKCIGTSIVYDVTVPNIHEFCANGIRVSNCGEIPLCPYDSCRLLAINLFSYVDNPFYTKRSL